MRGTSVPRVRSNMQWLAVKDALHQTLTKKDFVGCAGGTAPRNLLNALTAETQYKMTGDAPCVA